MGRLENRTAIITGAGSGMGQAAARLFAAEGAKVLLTDIDERAVRAVAEQIGDAARAVRHDVADEAGWQAVVDTAKRAFGGVHILLNNAGSAIEGTPENATLENWRRVHAVNVEGVFLGCRAAIPAMRESGGGSIVNIASRAALGAAPAYLAAYGASKAAVREYTWTVAIYCARARYNIRCNSINPGAIDTPLLQASFLHGPDPEERRRMIVDRIPMGAMGRPIDIAYAALYLASDEAAYVTGAEINVDGGVACSV
jgi:NAD(P)-dependent dehydrogenase (short-subunit alcohol dehydrogenase family)